MISQSCVKRTYGRKQALSTALAGKSSELFDKATKCMSQYSLRHKIGLEKGQQTSHGTSQEPKVKQKVRRKNITMREAEEREESTFMIFNTHEGESKSPKQKLRKKKSVSPVNKKTRKTRRMVKKKEKVKEEGNSSLSPSLVKGNSNNSTPDLIVEDIHDVPKLQKLNLRGMRKLAVRDSFNFNSFEAEKPWGINKGKPDQHGKCVKMLSDICEENKRSNSSSSKQYSDIEIARKSKDSSSALAFRLPPSPNVVIVKDHSIESSEDDNCVILKEKDREMLEGDIIEAVGEKNPPLENTSAWITTYTDSPVQYPSPPVNLLQSPNVNMRHQGFLNSTAKTAADNITQQYFPGILSPINQLSDECTPGKTNEADRFAPRLTSKKRKSSLSKKDNDVRKCSTKLFLSSSMNERDLDMPNFTTISSNCVKDSITFSRQADSPPKESDQVHHDISRKRSEKKRLNIKTPSLKEPVDIVDGNGLTKSKKPSSVLCLSPDMSEQNDRKEEEKMCQAVSDVNERNKLKDLMLEAEETSKDDYNCEGDEEIVKDKEKVHCSIENQESTVDCHNRKHNNQSPAVLSNGNMPRRSILKNSNASQNSKMVSQHLKKGSNQTSKIDSGKSPGKNMKHLLYDDSICFVNRLFMKSLMSPCEY